jgi:predicted dinucleotide-binding enzyme
LVLFTLPAKGVPEAAAPIASELDGKTLVDATHPLGAPVIQAIQILLLAAPRA